VLSGFFDNHREEQNLLTFFRRVLERFLWERCHNQLIGGPPRIPGLVGLHEFNHKGAGYARHRLDYAR
jgi:hypothetical protein